MQAVLDWTYANVSKPRQIFVTGSSAGAIPAFLQHLLRITIPSSPQLGDGAGGYRRMNNDTRPTNLGARLTSLLTRPVLVAYKVTR